MGIRGGAKREREAVKGKIPNANELAVDTRAAPSASGGTGSDSGAQSSTTSSGISAGVLTITDATKQAATGKPIEQALAGIANGLTTSMAATQAGALTQAWNGETLLQKVHAQAQITQAFSAQMPRKIAQYASQQEVLIKQKLAADPENLVLRSELANWGEGGSYRVALHTVSGALSGGLGGALGAMTVAESASVLDKTQVRMSIALQERGMSTAAANATVSAIAESIAVGIGSLAGGTLGAASSLAVDTNNRQLHPIELKWVGTSAKDFAAELSRKYERPVSELDAMRLLTYAGESDVDKASQYAVSNVLFGQGYLQETQMLLDAKKYIVQNAKGTFVDEAGKTQKLFVATGADFANPTVYSDYKNNSDYRDFFWTVTSTNLLPNNPTAQERAVYDARESPRLASSVKSLLLSFAPA